MNDPQAGGIYLIVQFDWPESVDGELASKARVLHDLTQEADWIREVVAGSGGLGAGPSSLWIFWLENYAALDRLLNNTTDPICQAYLAFFTQMTHVSDFIREKVRFL